MRKLLKVNATIAYNGTAFRSGLEACWAAFFDLCKWRWEYRPGKEPWTGWVPTFYVDIPCGHSECSGFHRLAVAVEPYDKNEQFAGHPCSFFNYGSGFPTEIAASAGFGLGPHVARWEMAHGAGGGEETLENWVQGDPQVLWGQACVRVGFRVDDTSPYPVQDHNSGN